MDALKLLQPLYVCRTSRTAIAEHLKKLGSNNYELIGILEGPVSATPYIGMATRKKILDELNKFLDQKITWDEFENMEFKEDAIDSSSEEEDEFDQFSDFLNQVLPDTQDELTQNKITIGFSSSGDGEIIAIFSSIKGVTPPAFFSQVIETVTQKTIKSEWSTKVLFMFRELDQPTPL